MSRISDTFERLRAERRTGIVVYVTVGFPDVVASKRAAVSAIESGADIIELGMPFSDPLADGATIQRSSSAALESGVNVGTCLEAARSIRAKSPSAPILFMGYYNPILRFGLDRFASEALNAGADGAIVPDLPPEESASFDDALKSRGLDLVYLLAPTSPPDRVRRVAANARGFIYCVSLTGVTGARARLSEDAPSLLRRVREYATVPLALGFGISGPEQIDAVKGDADAVVIASAFIDMLERHDPSQYDAAILDFIGPLAKAAKHDRGPSDAAGALS